MFRMMHDDRGRTIFSMILLAAGMAAVFGIALTYGFAPMDDQYLIARNLAVRSFSFASIAWFFTHFDPELYIPVTFISFMMENAIVGLQPWFFHLTNIVLHLCNALMVGALTQRLTGSKNLKMFAMLLFAFHPITVEAVVWISARKDILATFFALASLLTALHANDKRSAILGWCAVLLFALGVLAKVSIAPLPLLLVAIFWMQNEQPSKIIRGTAPYFLLSVIGGCIAILGKTNVLHSVGIVDRIVLAGQAIDRTLLHIVFPFGLHLYYQPFVPALSAESFAVVLLPCVLIAFAYVMRTRIPLISFCILWFLLFLAPSILNIQTDIGSPGLTFAADRYAYLPWIGCVVLITFALQRLMNIAKESRAFTVNVLLSFIIGILMILSWQQTSVWASASDLYTHALKIEPTAVHARTALAEMLRHENKINEAFDLLKQGLAYGDDPVLHLAAGYVYAQAGQTAEAEQEFRKTIDLAGGAPEATFAIAGLRLHDGKTEEAKALYEEALKAEPLFIAARIQLATILFDEGSLTDAQMHVARVLQDAPFNPDGTALMAEILLKQGDANNARVYAERALQIEPFQPLAEKVLQEMNATK